MSRADFFESGSWNVLCDRCGRKLKAENLRKEWDGFMVCEWCIDMRNPQDFVRGVPDTQSPPWTRPVPAQQFVTGICTAAGRSAIPALAVPGCAVPSLVPSGVVPPNPFRYYGMSAIPSLLAPGIGIPSTTLDMLPLPE